LAITSTAGRCSSAATVAVLLLALALAGYSIFEDNPPQEDKPPLAPPFATGSQHPELALALLREEEVAAVRGMPRDLALQELPIDRPFGLGGVGGTVAWVVLYTGVALHWASLVAALVCGAAPSGLARHPDRPDPTRRGVDGVGRAAVT
jgi:hypothetical protein